jgi:acyl-CoA dehydrogenase
MLLNPNRLQRKYPDSRSGEIMAATVEFFESRGKARLKHDDHERVWYSDFLNFIAKERIFASLLTPAEYGADDCRWDTYRISEFAEIIGFYGLSYWYPFQVTALGLGPIWMSDNEDAKCKAAAQLEQGEVFAFGLSERTHGADVYQTDMILTPSEHGWTANGEKYYIGNANVARMVSTFGKIEGSSENGEYVFFAADSQHDRYDLIKNVVNSQNYVANYALKGYPVTEADLLHRGPDAFHAALNTVNVCKYNLGWGAVGMCTHAMYEAVTHAANRHLYGTLVTDFSHVRRLLTDAYLRLVAMRLVCSRASDYMRSASAEDRRYESYRRGRACHHRPMGCHRRQGRGEGHLFRDRRPRDRAVAQAGRHRPHQHRTTGQVHAQLPVRSRCRAAPDPASRRRRRRHIPVRPGTDRRTGQGAVPRLARVVCGLHPPAQRRSAARANRRARRDAGVRDSGCGPAEGHRLRLRRGSALRPGAVRAVDP